MRCVHNSIKGYAAWFAAFILVIVLATPAFAVKPIGGGVDHKAIQAAPIKLGTSGGWGYDLANGFCCGGTLGSLVQDSYQNKYILSNFHVFAADSVPGGNNQTATIGDPIIQPGLIDVGCSIDNAQETATLSAWADPLANTNVDAAIALITPGMVRDDGSILEIGTVSSATRAAVLRLGVKKSGRTTGLTRSKITGLNAVITVSYGTECGGMDRGSVTFTNQIVIDNKRGGFLAGGDSGSLLVEDVTVNPRAVGLLFAGSSSVAVANPISDVLAYFGVTMVGSPDSRTSLGAEIPDGEIEKAKKAQGRNAARLERVPGSVGHAIGLGRNGRVVIKVYVEKDTSEARAAVPNSVEGIPIEIEETGRIVPL